MPDGPGLTGPLPVPVSVTALDGAAGEVRDGDASDGVRCEAAHPHRLSSRRHGWGYPVLGRRAIRIGGPSFRPERTSTRAIVPASWSVTNRESPATASQVGFLPTGMGSPIGRSVPGSRRTRLPPERSASQTFPPATTIPTGNPPTWTRVIAPVEGVIRSTSPASAAVTQRYPPPAASPSVLPSRERNRSGGRRERGRVELQQPAGPNLESPQVAGLQDLIDRTVELASVGVVQMRLTEGEHGTGRASRVPPAGEGRIRRRRRA